ncbi:unnamed protein product [Chrysoparadoxa australica]
MSAAARLNGLHCQYNKVLRADMVLQHMPKNPQEIAKPKKMILRYHPRGEGMPKLLPGITMLDLIAQHKPTLMNLGYRGAKRQVTIGGRSDLRGPAMYQCLSDILLQVLPQIERSPPSINRAAGTFTFSVGAGLGFDQILPHYTHFDGLAPVYVDVEVKPPEGMSTVMQGLGLPAPQPGAKRRR